MKKVFLFFFFFSAFGIVASSQVLIALVFGDKLNTPNLEFGINVGANLSSLSGIENAKYRTDIAVGTYFTWKTNDRFYIQPEFFVRFPGGAKKMSPYQLDDIGLDSILNNSTIERKMSYFSLPIYVKYRVWKQLRVSVGPQFSLMSGSTDRFTKTVGDETDLLVSKNSLDLVNRFDVGISGGLSYKLKNGKGMNLEARFYYGFIDNDNEYAGSSSKNQIISLLVGIPIGAESDVVVESMEE